MNAGRRPGRQLGVWVLLGSTLAFAGCRPTSDGNSPRGFESTPQAPGAGAARAGADEVDSATKQFLDTAAAGGKAEVELANLALDKSRSDAVKGMARMIQQDHTQANAELLKLSQDIGVTVDDTLKPEHQALAKRLASLTETQFDQAYTAAMVEEHRKDVEAFSEATRLQQDAARDFAERTLPKLRRHLEHAEGLQAGRTERSTSETQ